MIKLLFLLLFLVIIPVEIYSQDFAANTKLVKVTLKIFTAENNLKKVKVFVKSNVVNKFTNEKKPESYTIKNYTYKDIGNDGEIDLWLKRGEKYEFIVYDGKNKEREDAVISETKRKIVFYLKS